MSVYFTEHDIEIRQGDARTELADLTAGSVDCVVTSPPYYGLRDYGVDGQIGLEASPAEYVETLRAVFAEIRRVLRPDGVLWLNLGDSYSGKANGGDSFDRHRGHGHRSKQGIVPPRINNTSSAPYKSLLGIPWRVALALVDDRWTLRNDVIWHKPNAMPESVRDRLSNRHEHLFLFSKGPNYWFDLDPIREPLLRPDAGDGSRIFGGARKAGAAELGESARRTGSAYVRDADQGRNPGDMWTIATSPFPGAHFACMPPALARRCILASCPEGGTVLDPFHGAGTTAMVARHLGRRYVGVEIKAEYIELSLERLGQPTLDFSEASA